MSQGPNPLQLGRLKSRQEIKTTARQSGAHGKERFIKNKRGWRPATMKNRTEVKTIGISVKSQLDNMPYLQKKTLLST